MRLIWQRFVEKFLFNFNFFFKVGVSACRCLFFLAAGTAAGTAAAVVEAMLHSLDTLVESVAPDSGAGQRKPVLQSFLLGFPLLLQRFFLRTHKDDQKTVRRWVFREDLTQPNPAKLNLTQPSPTKSCPTKPNLTLPNLILVMRVLGKMPPLVKIRERADSEATLTGLSKAVPIAAAPIRPAPPPRIPANGPPTDPVGPVGPVGTVCPPG